MPTSDEVDAALDRQSKSPEMLRISAIIDGASALRDRMQNMSPGERALVHQNLSAAETAVETVQRLYGA